MHHLYFIYFVFPLKRIKKISPQPAWFQIRCVHKYTWSIIYFIVTIYLLSVHINIHPAYKIIYHHQCLLDPYMKHSPYETFTLTGSSTISSLFSLIVFVTLHDSLDPMAVVEDSCLFLWILLVLFNLFLREKLTIYLRSFTCGANFFTEKSSGKLCTLGQLC